MADTAYDKTEKTLKLQHLVNLVTLGRGLDWTLVEINKAISLSGLTVLIMAFTPGFALHARGLVWNAMLLLWTHAVYSTYKFYSFSLRRFLDEKAIKKLSIALAVCGQVVLSAGYFGYISWAALMYGGIVFGISHFWTMEVDYKYVLQVRPFAYLPFLLAGGVLLSRILAVVKRRA